MAQRQLSELQPEFGPKQGGSKAHALNHYILEGIDCTLTLTPSPPHCHSGPVPSGGQNCCSGLRRKDIRTQTLMVWVRVI